MLFYGKNKAFGQFAKNGTDRKLYKLLYMVVGKLHSGGKNMEYYLSLGDLMKKAIVLLACAIFIFNLGADGL